MNALTSIAHVFMSAPLALDNAAIERRAQCAEAVESARRGLVDPVPDDDAAAFEAQCRRVRESHYVEAPGGLFHVC